MNLATCKNSPYLTKSPLLRRMATSSMSSCSETQEESSSCLFLHGLLGNRRNLNTLGKRICALHNSSDSPSSGHRLKGLWIDLPGHGSFRKSDMARQNITLASNPTFSSMVDTIDKHLQTQNSDQHASISTVVGHSFGGRLALQYAAVSGLLPKLKRVWLLDTVPGKANQSVEYVLDTIHTITSSPVVCADKKELVRQLTGTYKLDMATSQWLASSYKSEDGKADFGIDLDLIQSVLPEFATQDFHGLLDKIMQDDQRSPVEIDLVRGGKNGEWDVSTISKLQTIAVQFPKRFRIHVLPKAGHWVHTDDLEGLVNLFARYPTR